MNLWRVISTSFDFSTPVIILTRDVDGGSVTNAVFHSPPPPYCCIWNFRIGNIRQTTTPSFIKSSELNAPIDRTLTNDFIFPFVRSHILWDELSGSSSWDLYLCCKINVTIESVKSRGPQFVIHRLPTIDILDENSRITSPDTRIIGTPNITHGRASDNDVRQVTSFGDAVPDYIK